MKTVAIRLIFGGTSAGLAEGFYMPRHGLNNNFLADFPGHVTEELTNMG